ncbi:TolB family protein [Pseudoalteromonas luteoviolacea]|uniref:Bacterial surface antigen (D15) domain-containing protein n=1 Tax=Pseudoalteromonas luteoviolacea S4060-1 TaxID=1365257 RepID=A0A167M5U6_9GAMM|nr:hypothetical protein [Pseudoalteromonas luteoviolacea]KZN65854.1 hypothetical protein N478_20705 [Pseudoalteromonas luteoviolacea S4060-1]
MQKCMLLWFVAGLWLSPFVAHGSEWQTISTPHFKVHFQPQHQIWAQATASELEKVRSDVLAQQSRALHVITDAIILDPFNLPNGYALPSSDSPFMVLYVTPPQSDMEIAHHQSWLELLVLHEYIHLVHLSQPSRHSYKQWLRDLNDGYDLATAALPRWVAEGYATLQESKLTGKGRLFDNYSEALLRVFARQGALLPYAALNFGDGSYRASAMAYLLGSRFLAWLEAGYGQKTLDAVWTRVVAVESRSFESAFSGVFGQTAQQLYRRFVAEFTYQAMQEELQMEPVASEEFMRFSFAARDVQLSPSQRKFVVVETDKQGNTRLKVYASEKNDVAMAKFTQRQAALLERDPNDIPDKQPESFLHEVLAAYMPINFSGVSYPQWLDEETLYFVVRNKTQSGNLINDLYRWHISSDHAERVSHDLGVRRFTIVNQTEVIAERVLNGFSQLVRFNLQTQEVTRLFESKLDTVFDYPVVDSAGRQLAFMKQTPELGWQVHITSVDAPHKQATIVPLPENTQYVTAPKWHHDLNTLYFIAGRQSGLGVYQYDLSERILRQLSAGHHVYEEVVGYLEEQLLFLESTAYGTKLSALSMSPQRPPIETTQTLNSAVKPDKVRSLGEFPIEPYQALDQDWAVTLAAHGASASEYSLGVGMAGSDILKKYRWQLGVNTSPSNDFLRGGYADLQYSTDNIQIHNALRVFDLNLEKQADERMTDQAHFDGWSNTLELTTLREGDKWHWQPSLGWHAEKLASSLHHSYWLGSQLSYRYDRQSFAFGLSMDAAHIWGENQGHRLTLGGYAKLWEWPFFLKSSNRYRTSAALQLGGYDVNSIYNGIGAAIVQSAELPYFFATGQHYLGYEFATSWKLGMPRLFIKRHRLDSEFIAQSWGAKWQLDLSRKVLGSAAQFAPAGVSNLRLDIGLSRVVSDEFEDEWRAWFGLWHAL